MRPNSATGPQPLRLAEFILRLKNMLVRLNARNTKYGLALALFIFATPPLALIAIDMVGLATAENEQKLERRRTAIYDALVDEADRAAEWTDTSTYSMDIRTYYRPFDRLYVSKVDAIQPTSHQQLSPDALLQSLHSQLQGNEALLQNFGLGPYFRNALAAQTMWPLNASAMRACISTTPLSAWSIVRYKNMVTKSKLKFTDGLIQMEMIRSIKGKSTHSGAHGSIVPELGWIGEQRQ